MDRMEILRIACMTTMAGSMGGVALGLLTGRWLVVASVAGLVLIATLFA